MRHKFPVLTVKKWLKSVYIYGSHRKNKIGVPFFWPPCMCWLCIVPNTLAAYNDIYMCIGSVCYAIHCLCVLWHIHCCLLWLKQLVDLPCITESLKTTDRKNFFKTADISQVGDHLHVLTTYDDLSNVYRFFTVAAESQCRGHFSTWLLVPKFRHLLLY